MVAGYIILAVVRRSFFLLLPYFHLRFDGLNGSRPEMLPLETGRTGKEVLTLMLPISTQHLGFYIRFPNRLGVKSRPLPYVSLANKLFFRCIKGMVNCLFFFPLRAYNYRPIPL